MSPLQLRRYLRQRFPHVLLYHSWSPFLILQFTRQLCSRLQNSLPISTSNALSVQLPDMDTVMGQSHLRQPTERSEREDICPCMVTAEDAGSSRNSSGSESHIQHPPKLAALITACRHIPSLANSRAVQGRGYEIGKQGRPSTRSSANLPLPSAGEPPSPSRASAVSCTSIHSHLSKALQDVVYLVTSVEVGHAKSHRPLREGTYRSMSQWRTMQPSPHHDPVHLV